MRAGLLSERLTIQAAAASGDGQGGFTDAAPTTVAVVWAEPIARGASEILQAESIGSHARYQFRIRARADVTPRNTIVWTPRYPAGMTALTLQVLGVQPELARKSLLLDCAVVQ